MTPDSTHIEEPLNFSGEDFTSALNQAALGFWQVDLADGNRMTCTGQCKRNFGRDPRIDFSYEDMLATIVPEDQAAMQAAVGAAIQMKAPYFSQYRVKHPDGAIRWIEAKGIVVYEAGIPKKITGTTIDITKVKDLEILRDELLSVAMHELKTPLSAVKGSLQIIERHLQKQNDEKILGIAVRALGSTERITRLLTEMAEPVSAHAPELTLQKTGFDLVQLVNEVVANAQLLVEGAEIKVISDQNSLVILADRFRINQVITNLINNAIKYSPNDIIIQVAIIISNAMVTIKISDQGSGIPPEDRNKVFQKFYRSGKNNSIDGLGIGLHLCSEIIVRHGGTIGIAETKDPGTTVCFSLPF